MNPELLRSLWLELSVRRLIAMPLVLAILFAAPLIREHPKHAEPPATVTLFQSPFPDGDTSIVVPVSPISGMNNLSNSTLLLNFLLAVNGGNVMAGNTANFAAGGLIFSVAIAVLLFLWGTRLAADSLFAEVNGRTWDSQRSSTIGPWAMTIGKLFGSTAYVWYGAVFCLAFWGYLQFYRPATIVALMLAGLWTQSLALFVALLLLRMAPDRTRFRVTFAQAVVLPVAVLLVYGFGSQTGIGHWYAFALPNEWLLAISLLLAFGWTLVGIYQMMRAELQLATQPGAWIGFLIMLGLYAGGFAFQPGAILTTGANALLLAPLARSLLMAATAIVLLAPISALMSPPQLLPLRQFLSNGPLGLSKWRGVPSWTWPLIFAGVLTLAAAIVEELGGGIAFFGTVFDGPATLTVLLLLLFALRDIGILHVMALNPASRRGVLATIVVVALCYFALPVIARAVHASDLATIFRPDFFAPPGWSISIAFFDVVLVWALAARTFRRLARRLPIVVVAALILAAGSAQAAPGQDACPRTTAHEMLMEAGLVFTGQLLSQGPPPECASNKMLCGQEVLTFRVDRLLKGDGKPGATVVARRISASQRPLTTSDPRLAVPESGLFVLLGQPGIALGNVAMAQFYDEDEDGVVGGGTIGGSYTIDECLLGLPPGLQAEADAYAAKRDALRSAAGDAPTDADTAAAFTGHLLRNRDTAALVALQRAVLAFPASQAIRAQYLYSSDPAGLLARNTFFWNSLKTNQPAIAQALATEAKPDPANIWVKLLAIRTRKRPAEADSPLHTLNDFPAYSFTGLQFADASLRGADFADTHIGNSDFRGSDLTGADLRWAEFDNVDLSFAQLSDADLTDWNPSTRVGYVILRRIMIVRSASGQLRQIPMIQFTVRLRRATLDRARMERATLIGADLRQASLKQAVLRDADLRQADLRGADLTGADLTGAALDEARFDCHTKWPDRFVPAARPDPESDTAVCSQSLIVKE